MAVAAPAATAQFLLIAVAFAALTYAFVTSDFSLRLVVDNSHTLKPWLYKLAGVWGNHEGSMLLWVLILTLLRRAAAWFGGNLPPALQGAGAGGAGLDRRGVSGLHPVDLEPVPAARQRRRWTGRT